MLTVAAGGLKAAALGKQGGGGVDLVVLVAPGALLGDLAQPEERVIEVLINAGADLEAGRSSAPEAEARLCKNPGKPVETDREPWKKPSKTA